MNTFAGHYTYSFGEKTTIQQTTELPHVFINTKYQGI